MDRFALIVVLVSCECLTMIIPNVDFYQHEKRPFRVFWSEMAGLPGVRSNELNLHSSGTFVGKRRFCFNSPLGKNHCY